MDVLFWELCAWHLCVLVSCLLSRKHRTRWDLGQWRASSASRIVRHLKDRDKGVAGRIKLINLPNWPMMICPVGKSKTFFTKGQQKEIWLVARPGQSQMSGRAGCLLMKSWWVKWPLRWLIGPLPLLHPSQWPPGHPDLPSWIWKKVFWLDGPGSGSTRGHSFASRPAHVLSSRQTLCGISTKG